MPVTWTLKPVTRLEESERTVTEFKLSTSYLAFASEPTTSIAAHAVTGVPAVGAVHPDNSLLRVKSRKVTAHDATRTAWLIKCDWDTTIGELATSPLSDAPKFSYDSERQQETYFKDAASTPKLARNTAGDPFDELPTRNRGVRVISMERNVAASASYGTFEACLHTTNAAALTLDGVTYATGTLYCSDVKLGAPQECSGVDYKVLSVTWHAKKEGWKDKFESKGFYQKVGGDRVRIADNNHKDTEVPWPLDSAGAKVADPATEGHTIKLQPYTAASHSALTS